MNAVLEIERDFRFRMSRTTGVWNVLQGPPIVSALW